MLAIGAAGLRDLPEDPRIEQGIELALRRIEATYTVRPLICVSPLGEGAERIVAERVLTRPGSHLVVPLPFAPDAYMAEFRSGDSRRRFLELLHRAVEVVELIPAPSRRDAFRAVARYVLARIQVLLAVWDGRPGHDSDCTAAMVARVRMRGLPLAWVFAGDDEEPGLVPGTQGLQPGMVVFERLAGRDAAPRAPGD